MPVLNSTCVAVKGRSLSCRSDSAVSSSFAADSDQEKEEWLEAMQQSIAEALSNFEVAERIWAVEANCFCADCGSAKPDWGSINLCVVICKRCAGTDTLLGRWGKVRSRVRAKALHL